MFLNIILIYLIQTAQVHELLGGAKILPKSPTPWVGRRNVTDRRQKQRTADAGERSVRLKSLFSTNMSLYLRKDTRYGLL